MTVLYDPVILRTIPRFRGLIGVIRGSAFCNGSPLRSLLTRLSRHSHTAQPASFDLAFAPRVLRMVSGLRPGGAAGSGFRRAFPLLRASGR